MGSTPILDTMKKFFIEFYDEWEKDKTAYFVSVSVLLFLCAIGMMLGVGLVKFAMAAPTAFIIVISIVLLVVALTFLPAIIGKHFKAQEDL